MAEHMIFKKIIDMGWAKNKGRKPQKNMKLEIVNKEKGENKEEI